MLRLVTFTYLIFLSVPVSAASLSFEIVCSSEDPVTTLIEEYQLDELVSYFSRLRHFYKTDPIADLDKVKRGLEADHLSYRNQMEMVDRIFELKAALNSDEKLQVGWVLNRFLQEYDMEKQKIERQLASSDEKDKYSKRPELVSALKVKIVKSAIEGFHENLAHVTSWSDQEKQEFQAKVFQILPYGPVYNMGEAGDSFGRYLIELNNNKLKMRSRGRLGLHSRFQLAPEINSSTPGWRLSAFMREGEEVKNHANLEFVLSPFDNRLHVRACVSLPQLASCKPVELEKFCGR